MIGLCATAYNLRASQCTLSEETSLFCKINDVDSAGTQDYNQQRPSEELAAKDFHGTEWKFLHIYRGSTTAEQTHS
ncbi:auxin response factor 15 [Hordeum vulgare]|nr:auxin response factor 15 [Hordeum vulgare]